MDAVGGGAVRRLVQVRSLLGAFPYDRKILFILGAGLLAALVAFGCRSVAVTLGGGAALGVAAAVGGMALTWAALLRTFGVSSEEAALLRLPRSWVKELS